MKLHPEDIKVENKADVNPVDDLSPYRTWGLTLLQLMGVLMVVGVILHIALNFIF